MRSEVKKWAKEKNNGNKWNIWKVLIVVALIESVLSLIAQACGYKPAVYEYVNNELVITAGKNEWINTVLSLLLIPINIGVVAYVVNIVREKEFAIKDIFSKYSSFVRIFVTNILEGIIIFLWSLLLIIPGIIRALSYSLVNYILADSKYDDLSSSEILALSKKLMDGHKMDYFLMNFYYCLLIILGVFTLGILWIWIIPEMQLANAKFATNLLDENK